LLCLGLPISQGIFFLHPTAGETVFGEYLFKDFLAALAKRFAFEFLGPRLTGL
jgi:hypothetical protein